MRKFGRLNNIFIPGYVRKNTVRRDVDSYAENQNTSSAVNSQNTVKQNISRPQNIQSSQNKTNYYTKQNNKQSKNYFNYSNYIEYVNRHNALSKQIDEQIKLNENKKDLVNETASQPINNSTDNITKKSDSQKENREDSVRFNINVANNVKIEGKKKNSGAKKTAIKDDFKALVNSEKEQIDTEKDINKDD